MIEEFKKFALRGNVIDLAIGVIIGAAFGAIVSSIVGDIIMPVIGAITGGLDFSNYYLPLSATVKTGLPLAEAKKAGAVLAYGSFITATLCHHRLCALHGDSGRQHNQAKKRRAARRCAHANHHRKITVGNKR